VCIDDYIELCPLKYERLPEYEHLSQAEYVTLMREKLSERTKEILRIRNGKPRLGVEKLLQVKAGTQPKKTTTSGSNDYRP
jgi:hypothetical protein